MKPAPLSRLSGYKNTYGGRSAVYRIADCVPMREKRPLTSKQLWLAATFRFIQRLNSTSGRMARQAYDWLSRHRSSGYSKRQDSTYRGSSGNPARPMRPVRWYLKPPKPTVAIGAQAAAVHGISEQALCGAPSWTDVAWQLRHAPGTDQ